MRCKLLSFLVILLVGATFTPVAVADEAVGIFSFDLSTPPNEAQFDIINQTGPNSSLFPDTTFPVTTTIDLSSLSLVVSYASGPTSTFGSSYFTSDADGISWDGTPLSLLAAQPVGLNGAISAVLSGTFSTTSFLLNDGTTFTADSSFTATITDPTGLTDGDFAIIYASGAGSTIPPSITPEPESLMLVGTGIAALAGLRRRLAVVTARRIGRVSGIAGALVVAIVCLAAPVGASAQVRLNTWTSPSSGATGSTVVNITGTGFPSGTINPSAITLTFSSSCGGATSAMENPSAVRPILGTSDRVAFTVPASLTTGNYFVSLAGATTSSVPFSSTNCSEIQVTHTSTALSACLPSSSLAVLTGTNVTAYVPKGYWNGGFSGVSVVPIEGSGTPATISTINPINSCSSNSQTGETVCVDNFTNVYEITGSNLNMTLTSGSNSSASFSGGTCENCGVAIDALTNTAVINMGLMGGASGDGIQLLNLANNTFSTPFPSHSTVSENISIDPNRNLILSPDENNIYDLFKISPTGGLTEYENQLSSDGEFDSAAEDCTTGIALSTEEFTNNLYIIDLSQAVFTEPTGGLTYGTWTAPGQSVSLYPDSDFGFSAGTSGISVAAGTTHLGITAGEFGGNTFAAFQLPATSGSGTPNFVDYVGASLPNTPDGQSFSMGYDPHTLTAYTSPNNGKAYGLVSDWILGTPSYVAVIDLQALLNAPRSASNSHIVDSSVDLLATGIVRYVSVP